MVYKICCPAQDSEIKATIPIAIPTNCKHQCLTGPSHPHQLQAHQYQALVLAIGGDSGGDGGSDFIVHELLRTGRAVCGNKPAVSTACIYDLQGYRKETVQSRIVTVMGLIAAGSPSVTDAIGKGSPSVTDAIAAGSPSRRRVFSAVAGCFLLATRTKQFIFLYSCIK